MAEDFVIPEADRDFVAAALHHYSKTMKAAADVASTVQDTASAGASLMGASKRADLLASQLNPCVRQGGLIVGLKFPRP